MGETLWVCGEVLDVYFRIGFTDINTEPRWLLSLGSLPSNEKNTIDVVTWMDQNTPTWQVNMYEGKSVCVYGKISIGKWAIPIYVIHVIESNRIILR